VRGSRLLIVHSSADRYGSDIACLVVATATRDAGWHVDVLLPHDGPLVGELSAGIRAELVDSLVVRRAICTCPACCSSRSAGWWHCSGCAAWARGRSPYDVVHSNCLRTLGGALLARWWGAVHVRHVHEILTSRWQRAVYDQLLCRSADAVVTCSRSALHQFPRLVASGKGRVAYTGARVAADVTGGPVSTARLTTIVSVGRLNGWKGQQVLVDAVGRLVSRGHDVRLQLVGSVFRGEERYEAALRRRVDELGLGTRVELLGERRDAAAVVAAADIAAVATTRPEPFGMALVEAMALGRPVVASLAGGPAEFIVDGRCGLLVTPGDAVALADAIERLVADPAGARRIGAAAVERAGELTTGRMTTVVLDTYRSALQARR
jgi:glycosyltransferase involved in cell wall biosynthesis